MNHPDTETMEVLVIVDFPDLQTHTSEEAWEQDIVDAVSAAVYTDKTLDTIAVKRLEYEDCQWVLECGMPLPDYDVTIYQNGSWNSGTELCPTECKAKGEDLQSLFDHLIEKGLVKK